MSLTGSNEPENPKPNIVQVFWYKLYKRERWYESQREEGKKTTGAMDTVPVEL